jgi:hypothetical protein
MRKRKGILSALIPVVLILGVYLVFYSSIETKPSDAGFWLIIALGISMGTALTRIIWLSKETDNK